MSADSNSNIGRETELKLIICSHSPWSVYGEISSLKHIAGLDLSNRSSKILRDRYLDTPEGSFSKRLWALRNRTIKSNHFIAMKGPAATNDYGALERPEIEGEWSKDMLTKIVEQAQEIGIELPRLDTAFDERNPLFTLAGMGFKIIQDRETNRHISQIKDQKGAVAVEMALDHVKYRVWKSFVNHYEIELESMSSSGEKLIMRLSEGLFSLYGNTLRKWIYDKLVLGWAIEELLDQPDASEFLDNGCLTSFAYDRIESMMSH